MLEKHIKKCQSKTKYNRANQMASDSKRNEQLESTRNNRKLCKNHKKNTHSVNARFRCICEKFLISDPDNSRAKNRFALKTSEKSED